MRFLQHVMELFKRLIKLLDKTETTAVDIFNIMADLWKKKDMQNNFFAIKFSNN